MEIDRLTNQHKILSLQIQILRYLEILFKILSNSFVSIRAST